MAKYIISGGTGLLGVSFPYFVDCLLLTNKRNINHPVGSTLKLDSFSLDNIDSLFANNEFDTFIHCAAYTNVDQCEINKELAHHINVTLTMNVADMCRKYNKKLIFISTDQLFDGSMNVYTEESDKKPINYYGYTKSIAEDYIQSNLENFLIIRTNFFGWGTSYRKSFSDFVITSLENINSNKFLTDVLYTPILRENLITLIIKISKYNGVFNISSDSAISKYDFACHVAKIFAYDSTSIVKTKLYKLPHNAKRPKNMVLSNDKLKSTLDIRKIDILDDISVLLLQLKTQYYRDITTL